MAQKRSSEDRITALAEKLFVANWQPNSNWTTDHLASLCLEAAGQFYKSQTANVETELSAA